VLTYPYFVTVEMDPDADVHNQYASSLVNNVGEKLVGKEAEAREIRNRIERDNRLAVLPFVGAYVTFDGVSYYLKAIGVATPGHFHSATWTDKWRKHDPYNTSAQSEECYLVDDDDQYSDHEPKGLIAWMMYVKML
jgi:hypothetical protein